MSETVDEICIDCAGRGFQWQTGVIISRRTGTEIATTRQKGEACLSCFGTGKNTKRVMDLKKVLLGFCWQLHYWVCYIFSCNCKETDNE